MNLSPHGKRWLTSVLLLPLLGCAVYFSGWWLFALVAVISCAGQLEFLCLFKSRPSVFSAALHLGLGIVLLFLSFRLGPMMATGAFFAAFWIANMGFLFRFSRTPKASDFTGNLLLLAGLVYLPGTLQCALLLSPLEILFVLATVFASDTGAYYAGHTVGGPRIWPAVSPKKTWAGSGGGLALCVIVTLPFAFFWQGAPWGELSMPLWILMAALLNISAQLGDFFESALKRKQQVKDSGTLLPGHGGVLDRIDGLLFALPVYMACRTLYLLANV